MSRNACLAVVAVVLLSTVPAPLYGWGSATHAYIVRQVGASQGPACLPEIYGAVLPDVFNMMFGDPAQGQLWTRTHYELAKALDPAGSEYDKAIAFGFASHNESWGADQTAHIGSTSHPEAGYVIRKSDELSAVLRPQVRLFLLAGGIAEPDAAVDGVLPEVAHTAIETAIDLLISQNEDPEIGARLVLAARTRGWSAQTLLCKAYGADIATAAGATEAIAAPLIVAAENEFRLQIETYGAAFSQADPAGALAKQGVDLAALLLAAKQGIIIDIPEDLMKQILSAATDVVKADYKAEVAATITRVRQELASHAVAVPAL